MRIGSRMRKERQKRKGQEVGVLKGWEHKKWWELCNNAMLRMGPREETKKKRAGMGGGELGPPFLPTTINTVHEYFILFY